MARKKKTRQCTIEELWNPQINLSYDGIAYARQSTKEQYIENIQSHISQTVGLLKEAKQVGFKDDGSTGIVTLVVENQAVDGDGNIQIKNASGTWPIDKRPGLKNILDLIEEGKVKTIIVELVDRLFRDEDRIDSNIFIKTCKEHDCFVYVTSKKMIYNFANSQMAEMFRMEVAFAAAYIENHVKETMLRRRNQAVAEGQAPGGCIPMGFIICNDIYPTESIQGIMKTLPEHTWGAISHKASLLHLHLKKDNRKQPSYKKDLSWSDIQFLEQTKVTVGMWENVSI